MSPLGWGLYVAGALAACLLAGWGSAELAARLAWPQADPGTRVLAFALGAGMAALPLALWGWLARRVGEAERHAHALALLRPLMGHGPLALEGAEAHFAAAVVGAVERERAEVVVALEAGAVAVLLAAALRDVEGERIVAIESGAAAAETLRRRLHERGLEPWAEVLETGAAEPPPLPERIDLLVVGSAARAAAGPPPGVRERLRPGARVFLSEGARPRVLAAVRRWGGALGAQARYVPGGRGAWTLRAPGGA